MLIIQMIFKATIVIIIIFVLRKVLHNKLAHYWYLLAWAVVMVQLLVPFSIPIGYSPIIPNDTINTFLVENANLNLGWVMQPIGKTNEVAPAVSNQSVDMINPSILWFAGIGALAFYSILIHLCSRHIYKTALPINDLFIESWKKDHKLLRDYQIKISDRVVTPITYGICSPVIILPQSMDLSDEEQLNFVLIHEFTHIRYFDILYKLVSHICLCIYWFNPFVWLMHYCVNQDIELSCDEKVVFTVGHENGLAYARTLIMLKEHQSGFHFETTAFSRNFTEERIYAIMEKRKIVNSFGAFFICTILACTFVLAIVPDTPMSIAEATPIQLVPQISEIDIPVKNSLQVSEEEAEIEYHSPLDGSILIQSNSVAATGDKYYAPEGSDVFSPVSGIVVGAAYENQGALGKYVVIEEKNTGYYFCLANLSTVTVHAEDVIDTESVIGQTGIIADSSATGCIVYAERNLDTSEYSISDAQIEYFSPLDGKTMVSGNLAIPHSCNYYAPKGENVFSPVVGVVAKVVDQVQWPYGKYIIIQEVRTGYYFYLCHLSEVSAQLGEQVSMKNVVGLTGTTGSISDSGCGVFIQHYLKKIYNIWEEGYRS